jgi:hypothetical protein
MQAPRKLWLMPAREFQAACQGAAERMSVSVNFGLCRTGPQAKNEAVHVHRLGLAYTRAAMTNLQTETKVRSVIL